MLGHSTVRNYCRQSRLGVTFQPDSPADSVQCTNMTRHTTALVHRADSRHYHRMQEIRARTWPGLDAELPLREPRTGNWPLTRYAAPPML